ncbi:hypothetical protein ACFOQM_12510 [Paenibacillus sp. GCM10012307]|uniref:Transglycosylase n=1 Tax=Paenibacillus roseus TaxID=2798579 RepID=A0A934J2J6_9BACL|nr:hypothetical protein [Paenibacillus roseus]MBJ6362114.1 hypothetical protein [Paenibacillus roseus]
MSQSPSNTNVVSCNAGCNKDFSIKQLNTSRMEDSIDRVWFSCGHCEAEYTAYYTNPEIRDLQKKISYYVSRKKDVSHLQKELSEKMNLLESRFKDNAK